MLPERLVRHAIPVFVILEQSEIDNYGSFGLYNCPTVVLPADPAT
jgi:hypothetical protein